MSEDGATLGQQILAKVQYPQDSYAMTALRPDTHYRTEVRAYNELGYSEPATFVVKTANGECAL